MSSTNHGFSPKRPRSVGERPRFVHHKLRCLVERSRLVHDKSRSLAERSSFVHDGSRSLAERSRSVHDKPRSVGERSPFVHDKPRFLCEGSRSVHDKLRSVGERSGTAHDKLRSVGERSRSVHDKPQFLRERSRAVHDKPRFVCEPARSRRRSRVASARRARVSAPESAREWRRGSVASTPPRVPHELQLRRSVRNPSERADEPGAEREAAARVRVLADALPRIATRSALRLRDLVEELLRVRELPGLRAAPSSPTARPSRDCRARARSWPPTAAPSAASPARGCPSA